MKKYLLILQEMKLNHISNYHLIYIKFKQNTEMNVDQDLEL